MRSAHPYQDGAQVLAVLRAALTAVENCRQSEDDPTICYEGTYHVMPFLQIVLFCKLPFCDAFLRVAFLRYASLRDAFLRVGSFRDASLRYAFLRVASLRCASWRVASLRCASLRVAF